MPIDPPMPRRADRPAPPRHAAICASSAGDQPAVDVDQGHRRRSAIREARRRRRRRCPLRASSIRSSQPVRSRPVAGPRPCRRARHAARRSVARASAALPRLARRRAPRESLRCCSFAPSADPADAAAAADIARPPASDRHARRDRLQPRLEHRAGRDHPFAARPAPRRSRHPRPAPHGSRRCRARSATQASGYPAAFEQEPRLGQRQPDDVGIAAGDVADIDFAIALQRIAAGLAAPLAVAGVIVDFLRPTAASSRSSSRPAGCAMPPPGSASATPVSTRCRRPQSSAMQARRVASSSTLGRIRRPTATTVSAASTSASRMPRGDRRGLLVGQAQAHGRAAVRPVGTLSSMSAGSTASGATPMRASRSRRRGLAEARTRRIGA